MNEMLFKNTRSKNVYEKKLVIKKIVICRLKIVVYANIMIYQKNRLCTGPTIEMVYVFVCGFAFCTESFTCANFWHLNVICSLYPTLFSIYEYIFANNCIAKFIKAHCHADDSMCRVLHCVWKENEIKYWIFSYQVHIISYRIHPQNPF